MWILMCGMMMIEIEIGRGNLLMKLATSLLYFSFEERFSKIDQMSGLYHKSSIRIWVFLSVLLGIQ